MKRTLKIIAICTGVVLIAALAFAASNTFKAKLAGKDQAPPVKTKAGGNIRFDLGPDGNTMKYKLDVKNIQNANAAHIHEGKKGENGAPVVGLFSGPAKKGNFSGTLAEGQFTADNFLGTLKGKPMSALVDMIKAGNAYVNVHTDQNPNGEIRGQIK